MFGCIDTDGDGVSDLNDAFDDDPSRWQDTDGDGYGDLDDPFPFDPTQWADSDGDGYGDNPLGLRPDAFPTDSSQWSDVDGDGWGDNATGNNADIFITDITQWSDIDGDGYGDNQFGINPDAYPKDATQWADLDGDGLGDNISGNNPDPSLMDQDNDFCPDPVNPDEPEEGEDLFPLDPRECFDHDGDGIGDNADSDDDNDGYSDEEEFRVGTSQFNAAQMPIEPFEVRLTDKIVLGAWDMVAMLFGVPMSFVVVFSLLTRNERTRRFEEQLEEARNEEELEETSQNYEQALLYRLIGPHQALRLERVRSKLENVLQSRSAGVQEQNWEGVDAEYDRRPTIERPDPDIAGVIGDDGYEWLEHPEGSDNQWFRIPESGEDWQPWEL